MFPINPLQLSFVTAIISCVLLLIIIYFTRPGFRRLTGSLAGGLTFAMLNIACDSIAYNAGWWHYPFTEEPHAPWLFYLGAGLLYGTAVALIGWRINRRFKVRGLLIFLLLLSIFGAIHDFIYASSTHLLAFGSGIVPVTADWSA